MQPSLADLLSNLANYRVYLRSHLEQGSYLPLLPLLEHPYLSVTTTLSATARAAGLSPDDISLVSLPALLSYTLASATPYWKELALNWIDTGFPLNPALSEQLQSIARQRSLPQPLRHHAARLGKRGLVEQRELDQRNLIPIIQLAAQAGTPFHQIVVLLQEHEQQTGRNSLISIEWCLMTAFNIPLPTVRDIELWRGQGEHGTLTDQELDQHFAPWLE